MKCQQTENIMGFLEVYDNNIICNQSETFFLLVLGMKNLKNQIFNMAKMKREKL